MFAACYERKEEDFFLSIEKKKSVILTTEKSSLSWCGRLGRFCKRIKNGMVDIIPLVVF
jgi:hypothetical protein